MQFSTTTIAMAAMSLFGMVAAQDSAGDAIIIVEDLRLGINTTLVVPIGPVFNNNQALETVSTLYLYDAIGIPSTAAAQCTPYLNADGTGNSGRPFKVGEPSRLSTNTVVVGSIVCRVLL
jgi:hypothetical protein